ncbi:FecR family protein [Pedobacter sp. UBA5917]|uniref:FecR family protein n=1 Tax=Pedobacter sp. UBA5917 TaxID=1947061 RepID=UPI003BEEF369
MLNKLLTVTKPAKTIALWQKITVAASVLVVLALGSYFFLLKKQDNGNIVSIANAHIKPGGNKAILTLADGKQVSLTDAKTGILGIKELSFVNKATDGKVVYEANGNNQISYNTISTPRGGQFQVVLPDGSNVWLNAESSITFPTQFVGNTRSVSITGEAYFEVVHQVDKPFKVSSANQTVEVLGTHFNINTYLDEPLTKTTLLEGKIKLVKGAYSKMLVPGEQAETETHNNNAKIAVKTSPDIEQVVAWKNGIFKFKNTSFKEVLRQVSRWYDVKVEYEKEIPDRLFSGEITRNVNLSDVLEILSYLKINFKIKQSPQGSTIIVTQ